MSSRDANTSEKDTHVSQTTAKDAAGLGDWIHRPLVDVDPDLEPFFDLLREHVFPLLRCKRCGTWWFPYTLCTHHPDIPDFDEMEWVPSSGRGTIFSKIVVHQVVDAAFADEVPYVLAIVALDEGPHFPGRLVECDPDEVHVGSRVEVGYVDSAEAEHTLPVFRLAA
jgi:uncharacterized OB-fold protein